MRQVRFLVLFLLLVVSHGGLPGAIPHFEAAHAHDAVSVLRMRMMLGQQM